MNGEIVLSIRMLSDGRVAVNGNAPNLVVALGLLEVAKEAVRRQATPPQPDGDPPARLVPSSFSG